jgi:hypothetical protein
LKQELTTKILALTMDLSIPKDASHVSEDVPSEENASETFARQEKVSETAGPVTADVLPDCKSENNEAISEAQIVKTAETAKFCGQPRWLIFALLGVVVSVAIGAGMGVALGNGGDDPQLSDRGIELQNRIIDEIPSSQFGSPQIKVINWLANEDPAMLDFETTPFETILERYAMVTLYYSLNGPQWEDQDGFFE